MSIARWPSSAGCGQSAGGAPVVPAELDRVVAFAWEVARWRGGEARWRDRLHSGGRRPANAFRCRSASAQGRSGSMRSSSDRRFRRQSSDGADRPAAPPDRGHSSCLSRQPYTRSPQSWFRDPRCSCPSGCAGGRRRWRGRDLSCASRASPEAVDAAAHGLGNPLNKPVTGRPKCGGYWRRAAAISGDAASGPGRSAGGDPGLEPGARRCFIKRL